KQEEKHLTGQEDKDTRNKKGKILAKTDLRTRRQYREVKNSEKFGKQDKKRYEGQGKKIIVESERINISQRRPTGKWKERASEKSEEGSTVSTSQKLLEEIFKRLVRLEERDNRGDSMSLLRLLSWAFQWTKTNP
ncbi:6811_t:CDS:1, partial [Gigaspora rosea]